MCGVAWMVTWSYSICPTVSSLGFSECISFCSDLPYWSIRTMSYLLQVSSALSFSQSGWINNLWVSKLVYISFQPSSCHIYGWYLSCSIQDQVFKHPVHLRASIMFWCLWDNFTWGSSFSRFTTLESMVLKEDQSLTEQIVNSRSFFEVFAYLY